MSTEDLTGRRFTCLVALRRDVSATISTWICVCDCGTEKPVREDYLKRGNPKSCGCLIGKTAKAFHTTHGKSYSSEYASWRKMLGRCLYSYHPSYHRYGGRGIKVCKRWLTSFENFYADMGDKPVSDYTIERIDNDKGYFPKNCKWIPRSEQVHNRSISIRVTWRNKTQSLKQWCNQLGLIYNTASGRLRAGWTIDEIFLIPVGKYYSNNLSTPQKRQSILHKEINYNRGMKER